MSESVQLAELRGISLEAVSNLSEPIKRITTDDDIETWKGTQGYRDYGLFLRRLNESAVGHTLPVDGVSNSSAISSTISALDVLDAWIDEIPPLNSPQRFGNLAFRTWGQRLEKEADIVLSSMLPAHYAPVIPHLKPYFLESFGSFTRMDYGTGHETSFALFLLCLTLLRFFEPTPEQERDLVLRVFLRYLRLCWRLQDVYRLEPAGSHGVWGLDDSHFLGYVFGSGQLRDQTEIPVSAVLHPPLPSTNLYFISIMRIHQVKRGPFHEHSSQLHAIATGVPNWKKVNSGLFKMYEAEVLGKRVVVQHIPLGGIIEWDSIVPTRAPNPEARTPRISPMPSSMPGSAWTTSSPYSGPALTPRASGRRSEPGPTYTRFPQ